MNLRTITFDSSSDTEDAVSPITKCADTVIKKTSEIPQKTADIEAEPEPVSISIHSECIEPAQLIPRIEITSSSNPIFSAFTLTHKKKFSWRGTRVYFVLSKDGIPLLTSKIKVGIGHSNDPIHIMNGSEMHLSSGLFAATIISDNERRFFSLRKSGEYGQELITVQIFLSEDEPRRIRVYFLSESTTLTSKKPIRNPLHNWCLDFKGRNPIKSKKNAILIDQDGRDVIYVLKSDSETLQIEAISDVPALYLLTIGISICLCKK